MKKFEQ